MATGDPTLEEICTTALKRAGITNPDADEILDCKTNALKEVKSDITKIKGINLFELETLAFRPTTKGLSRYDVPSDVHRVCSINLIAPPTVDGYRDTAQAGSTASIFVASASLNETDPDKIIGMYLGTTGGQGANQWTQAISWNNTSKQIGVSPSFTTLPNNTTTYILGQTSRPLNLGKYSVDYKKIISPQTLGKPEAAYQLGNKIYLYYTPDNIYGLLYSYYADLDRLTETDDLFLSFLREWRSLFIQGIVVKSNQLEDEERYTREYQIYEQMLSDFAGSHTIVDQMQPCEF